MTLLKKQSRTAGRIGLGLTMALKVTGFRFNSNGWLIIHEATKSGFRATTYSLDCREEILGDWEIVTPEQVLSERGERG